MIRYIMPAILLCVSITQGMNNTPLDSERQTLIELRKVLKEEKEKKGTFIKKIISSLKECTNGKMLELQYFAIKSSYWWDKEPKPSGFFETDKFHDEKELIIDHKFLSPVYDRDIRGNGANSFPIRFEKYNLDTTKFLNSWESVKEKLKFFYNEDLAPNTIPGSLKEIMGSCNKIKHWEDSLDMYPSVYQMIRALKTLDYEKKEETQRCPASSREISGKHPSQVILEGVDAILKQGYYNHFIKQNHPLSKIVQNHLEKLKYKAEQMHFKPTHKQTNEYAQPILYCKILKQMDYTIQLMSAFDIDMDAGQCNIPGSDGWGDDKPRNTYYLYAQLYEVFNDLLFLLLSVNNQYDQKDFDNFLTQAYINRFPIFAELNNHKDLLVASYPMRSGMDAFANACMAIGHAPNDVSVAPKVKNLENTVYYEISNLIEDHPNRGEMKAAVFFSQKPNLEEKEHIKDIFIKNFANSIIKRAMRINSQIKPSDNDRFYSYIEMIVSYLEDDITDNKLYDFSKSDFKAIMSETYKISESEKEPIKNLLFTELKKIFSKHDIFSLKEIGKEYYFEVPMFMIDKRGRTSQDPTVLENFNDLLTNVPLVENSFIIENKHHSITTGMTTDTVNISHDSAFMDNLYKKINQIRNLKQNWNPSEEPFIILWDTTMEIDKGPCYYLMDKLREEIESGKVIFLLFKSLQKYANLGIGKTKAGVVTLVGKKTPIVENINNKLAGYGKDVFSHSHEYALMTFFYDPFKQQDNEVLYYQATQKNAQKIYNSDPTKYTISSGCLFTSEDPTKTGMPYSDTFGFAIPTVAPLRDLSRYSVGLNPKGLERGTEQIVMDREN